MPPTPNKGDQEDFSAQFRAGPLAEKFPPILTINQAAELAQIPVNTLYSWSSQGRLKNCSARAGKYLRIDRDKFLKSLFQGDFNVG